ncbi:MAG: hypothetical protein M1820_002139 [Bogoriella megaspora]|nr:MAG: hypothetical protein M1820_002139 [Bogoriella megaspora]
MNQIRATAALNAKELEAGIAPEASWHRDFADTAYVYIGGLPFDLSEGDIITIFSQYGEPTHLHLMRDKETGKSKGYAFLKYEDQRSTDLAVDNLGGAQVMGRTLRVEHARYKKKEGQEDDDGKIDKFVVARSEDEASEESEEDRPMLKEEIELAKMINDHEDDEDPMKTYKIEQKREEVQAALKKLKVKDRERNGHRHKHRHHKSRRDKGAEREDDHRRHRHRSERDRGHSSGSENDTRNRQSSRRHRSRERDEYRKKDGRRRMKSENDSEEELAEKRRRRARGRRDASEDSKERRRKRH